MKEIMSCHYQIINNIEYRKQFYEAEEYVRTKLPNTNIKKEELPTNIGILDICQGDIGNDGNSYLVTSLLRIIIKMRKVMFYFILKWNMLVIQKILYMKMRFCTELFTLEMI